MLEKHDRVIFCKDCGAEFDFTAGEQEFFEQNGLVEPIRCKDCRDKRKAERAAREQEAA